MQLVTTRNLQRCQVTRRSTRSSQSPTVMIAIMGCNFPWMRVELSCTELKKITENDSKLQMAIPVPKVDMSFFLQLVTRPSLWMMILAYHQNEKLPFPKQAGGVSLNKTLTTTFNFFKKMPGLKQIRMEPSQPRPLSENPMTQSLQRLFVASRLGHDKYLQLIIWHQESTDASQAAPPCYLEDKNDDQF